jgi:CRP/FNR family transcriptional regulator, cyclic AMP receptor protein
MTTDRPVQDHATEREAQLGRVPFFSGLTPKALSLIAEVTSEESHGLGTRIFQYGDPGDKLFIILGGKVRISREVSGLGEEALAVLGSGEVFGEMALLDESTRSADAIVHERCRL